MVPQKNGINPWSKSTIIIYHASVGFCVGLFCLKKENCSNKCAIIFDLGSNSKSYGAFYRCWCIEHTVWSGLARDRAPKEIPSSGCSPGFCSCPDLKKRLKTFESDQIQIFIPKDTSMVNQIAQATRLVFFK